MRLLDRPCAARRARGMMLPMQPTDQPPDPRRAAMIAAALDFIEGHLTRAPFPAPTPLEDFSLRHLAKGAGTTRAAWRLLEAAAWSDACVLTRAVFEQLFTYLWVVQDPDKADVRSTMVTIKQEWANAKYLEGLAKIAEPASEARLLGEAARYRAVAEALLAELAARLGTTEKKVRDEATLRVSLKAMEVNLGPRFSVPYAYYSGFVHSDGNALAAYGVETPAGVVYRVAGGGIGLPLASDLHRVLLQLATEVMPRCARFPWPGADAFFAGQAAWLAEADAAEGRSN